MVSNQGASESLNPTHVVQGCSPTKWAPFPNSQWKILSTVHIHSLRFWSFLSLTNFILSSLTSTAGSFGLLTLFTPKTGRNQCSQLPIMLTSWNIPVHWGKKATSQQVKCYKPGRFSGPSREHSRQFLLPLIIQLQSPYLSKCGGIFTMVSTLSRVSAKGKLQN